MTSITDDLDAGMARAQARREEIDALNDLGWSLRQDETERASAVSQRALALSTSDEFALDPYTFGQATSLTTQGYLARQAGRLDVALSQCLAAAVLLEDLPPARVTIDCQRTISWIYYFLGDTSNALDVGLRALRLAQDLELPIQEASVLDALALIYLASGDAPEALASNASAALIARNAGDRLLESTVLNNRANVLLQLGDLDAALAAGLESLALARAGALTRQETSIMDTVADVFLAKGDLSRAEEFLREGLSLTDQVGDDLSQIYYLVGLGKLGLRRSDLDQAEVHLQGAMQRADVSGTPSLQAECHAQLADLYERRGLPARALEHYKLFHALHDQVNGELAGKRLAAVKVAQQVATAQRDSEIYRLRNVELQREIEERLRVESELERLAATDPLTNLYNRRRFYELAQREFDRSVRYNRPFTVLMLDLDHFKGVNDAHGHAVGDQILALVGSVIRKVLRDVDVVGRYGGEEFAVVLTESDTEQGRLAGERIRRAVGRRSFETTAGKLRMTVSVGLASLGPTALPGTLDQLLDEADQALYRAKRAGRNRVETHGSEG